MAKIGVITFSNTKDNYGQVFQYLAIQEYLRQRGHEPFLLRYQSPNVSFIRKMSSKLFHKILKPWKNVKRQKSVLMELYDKWAEWSELNEMLHPRHFEEFRETNFNIKTIVGFNDEQISSFDAYAIGSDQIWSDVNQWNFLGFVPKGKLCFSIAPSTGNKTFTQEQIKTASMLLNKFSFVTCREDSCIEFCKEAGYEKTEKILDPTFLIDKKSYDSFVQLNDSVSKPYIFLYLLGAECGVTVETVFSFAQEHGLDVKYVASQGREDSFEKQWATVPEWISLMAGARYVITNSFHGMALSIVYQKQFLVLPVKGITEFMNERIISLAKIFSLSDRIYKESLDEIFAQVDYVKANEIIASNKVVLDCKMLEIGY